MMRTKMFSLIALTSAFAAGLALVSMNGTAIAGGSPADLCLATGIKLTTAGNGGCVYSSSDVPVLAANVCWDGTTAHLKGLTECPGNSRTYYAKFGELLNPLSGEVIAYAPLPDACDMVPCEPSDYESYYYEDGVACCNPNTGECSPPDSDGNCEIGDITWCEEVEDNGDGTVTCHE